ncbi:MAG: glucose 1-dehydrogenase [Dehalococcoidales bacterium]|nr:glucose 1-dehydrogenase [Dehalococcoidales bacterium]
MNAAAKRQFMDKFNLNGKVALITGGSRGIGKSIAMAMADAGADIIIASRKQPDLEEAAKEISQMGRKVIPIVANVRNLPEIDTLVQQVMDKFGKIDILVNNAATNPIYGPVFAFNEKAWDATMGLNLKGMFFLSLAVGKIMKDKGKGGAIVNISSEGGIRPGVGLGVYSISKAGVIMLTEVLAQEWGRYGIRVNGIAPGVIKTKFSEALWKDPVRAEESAANTALGRLADPDEMACMAVFMASDASSYMTGQTIQLDGGFFASVQKLLNNLPQ